MKHKLPLSLVSPEPKAKQATIKSSIGRDTMAVPAGLAASTTLPLLLLVWWLPLLASACDRCVRHSKAAYYTSSLTLAGTRRLDRSLCFLLL